LKILAVTDFHGDSEAFRMTALKAKESRANVVLICGDITHFGSIGKAKELLEPLVNLKPLVLFIPGNCDPPSLTENLESLKCIHGRYKQISEINFFGVGGSSPSPFDTPFELSEMDIAELLKHGFGLCDKNMKTVLVSHSPPKNTLVDITFEGDHVGSTSVRVFIEKVQPSLVVCGHIHEAAGIDKINGTMIVNPGPARHRRCAFINLTDEIKIKLDHL
jgi:Icc-related predicted phosphoesterase